MITKIRFKLYTILFSTLTMAGFALVEQVF